jgi:hypothetical protein
MASPRVEVTNRKKSEKVPASGIETNPIWKSGAVFAPVKRKLLLAGRI